MTITKVPARTGRIERSGLVLVVFLIAAGSWLGLAFLHGDQGHVASSAPSHELEHHGSHSAAWAGSSLTGSLRWVSGWVLMVVAMMLPPALPLLRVVRRLVATRRSPAVLVAATATAFIGVWTAAGAVLLVIGTLPGMLSVGWDWLQAHPRASTGTAAIIAGGYQFTSWKNACLTACRSPLGLAMTTWTGTRRPLVEASLIGARFGMVCVGCCWALMLLTMSVGAFALPVMVFGAVLMSLERLVPQVRPLVPIIATAAICFGVLNLAVVLQWS